MSNIYLGHQYPARQEAVDHLLANGPGDVVIDGKTEETRSEWMWFRLANGDLICGFYPQGDYGYFGTEVAWSDDYQAAEAAGTVRIIEAEAESQASGKYNVEPKRWRVEDNIAGTPASREYDNVESANGACRGLNLEYGPGGKYGVYVNDGTGWKRDAGDTFEVSS